MGRNSFCPSICPSPSAGPQTPWLALRPLKLALRPCWLALGHCWLALRPHQLALRPLLRALGPLQLASQSFQLALQSLQLAVQPCQLVLHAGGVRGPPSRAEGWIEGVDRWINGISPILNNFVPSWSCPAATLWVFTTLKKQEKGTADHMMPAGAWFIISFLEPAGGVWEPPIRVWGPARGQWTNGHHTPPTLSHSLDGASPICYPRGPLQKPKSTQCGPKIARFLFVDVLMGFSLLSKQTLYFKYFDH